MPHYRIKVERATAEITVEETWIPVEAEDLDEATDRAIHIAKIGIVPSREWDLSDVRLLEDSGEQQYRESVEFRRSESKEADRPARIPDPRQLRLFE